MDMFRQTAREGVEIILRYYSDGYCPFSGAAKNSSSGRCDVMNLYTCPALQGEMCEPLK